MEEYTPIVRNMRSVQPVLTQTYLDTVITMLLHNRNDQDPTSPKTVYKFNPSHLSSHFGLDVGGERVSSFNLIENIYRKRSERYSADISSHLMSEYRKMKPHEQEMMNTCLMQCLMFYELLNDVDKNLEDNNKLNNAVNIENAT